MKRIVKFRAKRVDNSQWAYGYYTELPDGRTCIQTLWENVGTIQEKVPEMPVVDPATVGQYVGRDDCEGNPIYEGDIIGLPSIYTNDSEGYTPFWVVEYDPWQGFKGFPREKVMGNIHDNQELMKDTDCD